MAKCIYREQQKFSNWILIMGLMGMMVVLVLALIQLVMGTMPSLFGSFSSSLFVVSLCIVLLIGILSYLLSIQFITKVKGKSVRFKFYPLHNRTQKILRKDILGVELVEISEQERFQGWMVNFDLLQPFYHVSGNKGIRLQLKDGNCLILGSQQPHRLKAAIEKLKA